MNLMVGNGNKNIMLLYMIIISVFLSCSKNKQINIIDFKRTYGINYNPIRRFIGLDTLNGEWINKESFVQNRFNRIDWFDKKLLTNEGRKPCYSFKTIWFQFGIPIMEGDAYILSLHTGSHNNKNVHKMIGYIYQFISDFEHNAGWRYYYQTSSLEKVRGSITKQQADSILHSWGLHRHYD